MTILTPEIVYDRYNTHGVPESGKKTPAKSEIIQLLNTLFGVSRGGWVVAMTVAELNGVTPVNATDGGVVLTGTGAGYYDRDGSAWVFGRGFSDTFARLTDAVGVNAVTAAVAPGVAPGAVMMFLLDPPATNTAAMTLNVAGDGPRPLNGFDGQPLQAGWVQAGKPVLFYDNGDSTYRLLVDHRFQTLADAAAASQAAALISENNAEAAEIGAEAARDIAAGYASDAVSQGNVPIYATVSGMSAISVPVGINAVRVNGYAAAGDGGGALFIKVGSQPSHNGKFQSQDGAWWELAPTDKTATPQMFGAKADGVNDDLPATQKAAEFLWAKYAGGVIYFAPGIYLFDSSLRLDGKSNIGLKGTPGHKSVLKASASLDGSHNWNKNDIVFAVNYPTGGIINARQNNIWAEDLVFDGTLQSADAIPLTPAGGYSLAGFECSRVDNPRVERCKFIKCYGNGVVYSSGAQSTIYASDGVTRNGVEHGIVKDCEFIECCRGPLPHYTNDSAPMGIPGSAIQIGAGFGCVVTNNYAYRTGGTFLECFNNEGMHCAGNYVTGTPLTVTGGRPTTAAIYHSLFGTIKSDFGLSNSHFIGNVFVDCGGFDLLGNMGGTFFNANSPTSGPKNCVFDGNVLLRPAGNRPLGNTTIKPTGSGNVYTAEDIQTGFLGYNTNQAMRIIITGGSGLTVSRRRGTDGSYAGVTLGPSQSFLLSVGDAFYLDYSGAPSTIGAVLTPNAFRSGFTLTGGTTVSASSAVTISVASPGVITWTAHSLPVNAGVQFTTTGALPTGLAVSTIYYVRTVLDANTFTVSATPGGAVINTSSTQSGVHTASRILLGTVERCIFKNNVIVNPGAFGAQVTDTQYCIFDGNTVESAGLAQASSGFWLGMSYDLTGAGSFGNMFVNNIVRDPRTPVWMPYAFQETGVRTLDNRFQDNELGTMATSLFAIANTPSASGGSSAAGNWGAGTNAVALAAPTVPATLTELHNPFPYDCFVFVAGGTVTAINTGPPSATVATGLTSGMVFVRHGQRIRLTYSVAPTWVWVPAQ